MKGVLLKLRAKFYILILRLKIFWSKITAPFRICAACVKRYCVLKKIDENLNDVWEKHVQRLQLQEADELQLKKVQFDCLIAQLTNAFLKTTLSTGKPEDVQKESDELDCSREDFEQNKKALLDLIAKVDAYEEINFDKNIKAQIISWEFKRFETQDDLGIWVISFMRYMSDI